MSNKAIPVTNELYKYVFDKNLKDIHKEKKKVSMDYTLKKLLNLKQEEK